MQIDDCPPRQWLNPALRSADGAGTVPDDVVFELPCDGGPGADTRITVFLHALHNPPRFTVKPGPLRQFLRASHASLKEIVHAVCEHAASNGLMDADGIRTTGALGAVFDTDRVPVSDISLFVKPYLQPLAPDVVWCTLPAVAVGPPPCVAHGVAFVAAPPQMVSAASALAHRAAVEWTSDAEDMAALDARLKAQTERVSQLVQHREWLDDYVADPYAALLHVAQEQSIALNVLASTDALLAGAPASEPHATDRPEDCTIDTAWGMAHPLGTVPEGRAFAGAGPPQLIGVAFLAQDVEDGDPAASGSFITLPADQVVTQGPRGWRGWQ